MLELQVAAIAASATARATAARNVRRHTSSKKNGAIRLEAQALTPYQPSLGIVPLIWAAMFDP